MRATVSPSTRRRYPLTMLCQVWRVARSSVYATRVDRWACRWAARAGIPCAVRCARSVLAADLLLVFPGRGTASMVRLARAAGSHVETA
jgi:hypothetical protein